MTTTIRVRDLTKTFVLHLRGGTRIPVLTGVNLEVGDGECVILSGPSGSGKSTLLRALYGNYRPDRGSIAIRHDGALTEIVNQEPRVVLDVRRRTMGYVSQFLRVIPRVSALDLVSEPLRMHGLAPTQAADLAKSLLARLRIPEPLWLLPPATFSGGEQQRINIARGFAAPRPVLLLDEPTASLDRENRDVVVDLINEARARGTAIVGICHDDDVRARIGTRLFDVAAHRLASA
jgi:alpha-D-ribose 1-methylphosphonate 5-triphosphate synthase subunit PhnL